MTAQQALVYNVALGVNANEQAIRQWANNMTVWDEIGAVHVDIESLESLLNASTASIKTLQASGGMLTRNVSALGSELVQLSSQLDTVSDQVDVLEAGFLDVGAEIVYLQGNASDHDASIAHLASAAMQEALMLQHVDGNVTLLHAQVSAVSGSVASNALAIRQCATNTSVWDEFDAVYARTTNNTHRLESAEVANTHMSSVLNGSLSSIATLETTAEALNITTSALLNAVGVLDAQVDIVVDDVANAEYSITGLAVSIDYLQNNRSASDARIDSLEYLATLHAADLEHIAGNLTMQQVQLNDVSEGVDANALDIRQWTNNMSVWEEFTAVHAAIDNNSVLLVVLNATVSDVGQAMKSLRERDAVLDGNVSVLHELVTAAAARIDSLDANSSATATRGLVRDVRLLHGNITLLHDDVSELSHSLSALNLSAQLNQSVAMQRLRFDVDSLLFNSSDHQTRINAVETAVAEQASVQQLVLENSTAQRRRLNILVESVAVNADALSNMNTTFNSLKSDVDGLGQVDAVLETNITSLNNQITSAHARIADAAVSIEVMNSTAAALAVAVDTVVNDVATVDAALRTTSVAIADLQGNASAHFARVESLESLTAEHAVDLQYIVGNLSVHQAQLHQVTDDIGANAQKIRQWTNNMSVWEEFDVVRAAVDSNADFLDFVNTTVAEVELDLLSLHESDVSLDRNLSSLRASVTTVLEKIGILDDNSTAIITQQLAQDLRHLAGNVTTMNNDVSVLAATILKLNFSSQLNQSLVIQGLHADINALLLNSSVHQSRMDDLEATVTGQGYALQQIVQNATAQQQELNDAFDSLGVHAHRLVDVNTTAYWLVSEVDNLHRASAVLEVNVSSLHSCVTSAEHRIGQVEDAIAGSIADSNATTQRLASDIAELQQHDAWLEHNVSWLHDDLLSAHGQIDDLMKSDVALRSNISSLGEQVTDIHSRIDSLDVDAVSANVKSLRTDVDDLEGNVTLLEGGVVQVSESLLRLNATWTDLESSDIATLHRRVEGLTSNASDQEVRLTVLERSGANMSAATNVLARNISMNRAAINEYSQIVQQTNEMLLLNASQQYVRLLTHDAAIGDLGASVVTLNHSVVAIARAADDASKMWSAMDEVNTSASRQSVDIRRLDAAVRHVNTTLVTEMLQKELLIDELQTTVLVQQAEIDALTQTVNSMNATLASVLVAVDQLAKGTTFAPFTSQTRDVVTTVAATGCNTDGSTDRPCVTTTTSPATTLPLPPVNILACNAFPCDGAMVTFAWNVDVAVVAEIEGDTSQFDFTLLDAGGNAVWEQSTTARFSSFVPSEVGVNSAEAYRLHVSVALQDGRTTTDFVDGLFFSSPPVLHAVKAQWVQSSAAANWFKVTTNATDATALRYEYWAVGDGGSWSYLVMNGTDDEVLVAVPSTREVELQVSVVNEFGSSVSCEECPLLARPTSNASKVNTLADALSLVHNASAGSSILLAAIDAAEPGDLDAILAQFVSVLHQNNTDVSQDIVVLNALVNKGFVDGFMVAMQAVGSRTSETRSTTSLALYLDTVDTYGSLLSEQGDGVNGVAEMDEFLGSVCAANEAGSVPDGDVSVFKEDSYSLSCASSEDIVAVEAGSTSVMAAIDGLATIAVSSWNGTMNASNTTVLLAGIHGVHVEGGRVDGDATEVTSATTLKLALSAGVAAARKAVSCVYYDEELTEWSTRGVVLRGLELDGGTDMRAVCASSHLTLFTLGDKSEAARVVEDKITSFADRIKDMNAVNFLDNGTVLNWNILGVFVGITVLFVIVIAAAKIAGRKAAVSRGRLTFQQDGELSKPGVLGTAEFEAMLRRWISAGQQAKLVLMELLTSNAVLGLLFHWDHEAIVFGRTDKSIILFGAVLMTFVASAFLFDPNEDMNAGLLVAMWSALVTAALTNVLLLPVQHFLPYMVSNVNSLVTLTKRPTGLLSRETKRISCWKPAKRLRHDKVVQARVLLHWVSLVYDGRTASKAEEEPSAPHAPTTTSTKLHFLSCEVNLPAAAALYGSHANGKKVHSSSKARAVPSIVRLQRRVRQTSHLRLQTRNVEFDAWYTAMSRERHVLALLSAAVLVVLVTFTLIICMLLSGTFNDGEGVMWVVDVAQSLTVQVFMTDPLVALAVIASKLAINDVLLRAAKKRLRNKLKHQNQAAEAQMATVAEDVEVVQARAKALEVVASGEARAVASETAAKTEEKRQCESELEVISLAKAKLLTRRKVVAKPRKVELEKWDQEQGHLDTRERRTRRALNVVEATLQALAVADSGRAKQELETARERMTRLQKRLKNISKVKASINRQKARVDDRPKQKVSTKLAAVVPVVSEEPALSRETVVVAKSRRKRSGAKKGTNGRRHRKAVKSSRGRRRPRTTHSTTRAAARGTKPSPSNSLARKQTAVWKPSATRTSGRGGTMSAPRSSRQAAMTWAEIQALQRELKAKAASSPPRSPMSRKISLANMSQKAMASLLQRRERIRKLRQAQARRHVAAVEKGVKMSHVLDM